MFRTAVRLAATMLVVGALHAASAQTTTTPAASTAQPSRMKLTAQKLKDMKARWSANRGKLKVCRAEVKSKGLMGDDRWFYMEDCMTKT